MPLEWTHATCGSAGCTGDTDCLGFPTDIDRINMARAAYIEYADSDGTSLIDFVHDVMMLYLHDAEEGTLAELVLLCVRASR